MFSFFCYGCHLAMSKCILQITNDPTQLATESMVLQIFSLPMIVIVFVANDT